jgi:hypothetical protein
MQSATSLGRVPELVAGEMTSPITPEIETPEQGRVRPPRRTTWWWLPVTIALALVFFWNATAGPKSTVLWTFVVQSLASIHADSLVWYPDEFAFLTTPAEEGVTMWYSDNGLVWSERRLAGSPTRLVTKGETVFAFAGYWIAEFTLEEEPSPDRLDFPLLVRVGYGSGRAGMAGGSKGLVAQAFTGDVFWSDGASAFQRVVISPAWGEATGMPVGSPCDPPTTNSVDVPPLVATDDGFFTMVSVEGVEPFGMWPVCQPQIWWSGNGRDWERRTTGSPLPAGAYVYDLGWRDGLLVAVGGFGFDQPALWSSTDGSHWELSKELPTAGYHLREVAAGPLGWVVLGENSSRPGGVGWISPDGECWQPLPDQIWGREAAVGEDRIVITEHGNFPLIWAGIASGGRQLGCDA